MTLLYKGRPNGTHRVIQTNYEPALYYWESCHKIHLEKLYALFNSYSQIIPNNIDYYIFVKYLFDNSSKYISPWL